MDKQQTSASANTQRPGTTNIAIVGMSTLLPGAPDLAAYWRRILSGESALGPVPSDRWSQDAYFAADPNDPDKIPTRFGGFIQDILFDPLSYGIQPATLPFIEPMQLLALQLVRDCVDDALQGASEDPDRERTSVIMGVSGGVGELGMRYVTRTDLPGLLGQVPEDILAQLPEWTQDSFAGILPNVISGRVSNRLNFGGSNFTVDAESAASLAAVNLAVMELISGRSDRVIAGGVDASQTSFGYLGNAHSQPLSPRGVCGVFDAQADGTVLSEGMAAIALRRLEDAERDGDRIYAVIKGVGAASDGASDDLFRTHATGQRRALQRAYDQAGFTAHTVDLFEAHGGGTVASDHEELEVLGEIVGGAPPASIAIGSVKPLIGHTKASAGVAGMIKAALGLNSKILPPHADVKTPIAALSDPDSPFYLAQSPRPWMSPADHPRRAAVSAFGAGGTNFHVVLEEYNGPCASAPPAIETGQMPVPLLFTAADKDGLRIALTQADPIAAPSLIAFAQAQSVKRAKGQIRMAMVATTVVEAVDKIAAALAFLDSDSATPPPGIHFTGQPKLAKGGKMAFLLPGEEAAYPGMLRQTALMFPALANRLHATQQVLKLPTPATLPRMVWPRDAFDTDTRRAQAQDLAQPVTARAALAALQSGLAETIQALGLSASAVAGRGWGRIVAQHLAGALSFQDLITAAKDADGATAATPSQIPVFDLSTGAQLGSADDTPENEDFVPEPGAILDAMSQADIGVLVDLGPGSAVSDRLRRVSDGPGPKLVSLDQDGGDIAAVMGALTTLWSEGAALDLTGLLASMADGAHTPTTDNPKTGWLINGAYARRADTPPRIFPDMASLDLELPTPIAKEPVDAPSAAQQPPVAPIMPPVLQPSDCAPGLAPILPRYIQVPFAESAAHAVRPLPATLIVLVTETADGFHQTVMDSVTQRGAHPILVPAHLKDAAEFSDWVRTAVSGTDPIALIHLDGRRAMPDFSTLTPDQWRAEQERGTKRFFTLIQSLAPRLESKGRIVNVSETGGLFGRDTQPGPDKLSVAPGILGIVKALTLEWVDCAIKAIDLDPNQDAGTRAGHILEELSFPEGRREAGYPAGQRTILRTEPAALTPPVQPSLSPDKDWVILATGGARGITAECLRSLASFGPRLVLIGRSPRPDAEEPETVGLDAAGLRKHYLERARTSGEKPRPVVIEAQVSRHLAARDMTQNLDDFAAMGATVDYRAVDAADAVAMGGLINTLYDQFGRIDMVVHGAGLIDDALLNAKSRASFDRVFDTKADSAFAILQALRPETLQALCFFTSVAGRYGNRGQTDYAAANETLNRLAWQAKRDWPHVVVRAINWGPWGQTTTGAGMVTDPVRQQFLSRGIGMVEAEPGRDLFLKEMIWSPDGAVESVGWVADGETLEAAACALPPIPDAPVPVGGSAVLLRNATRAPDAENAIDWHLDLVDAPFLDDHRFDGTPVLPVAVFAQAASEIPAILGLPDQVVGIENLRIFSGFTLDKPRLDLRFTLSAPDAQGRATLDLVDMAMPRRPRYRCDLILATNLPMALRDRTPSPVQNPWAGKSMPEIYRDWLSHGPKFHTLTHMDQIGDATILTRMRATRPAQFVPVSEAQNWTFDPGLIDGMLCILWIWSRAKQDISALPVSFSALRRYAGDPYAGPITVEVEILTPPATPTVDCNLYAWDANGALIYEIRNFIGQSAPQLNQLSGGWQGGRRPDAN